MNRPFTPVTRREVLKTAALGAFVLPVVGVAAARAAAPQTESTFSPKPSALRLGVAGYTLRDLTIEDSISALKALRITNVGVFKKHCDWETASVDEARAVAAKFHGAGLTITSSGVINLVNDEAKCRRAFENVKAAQMATMVCKPLPEALPLVEKLAKEYDQRLAIHNHGPEDKVWPSPYDVLKAVEKLDAHVGLCVDVGHTMRAGVDPVEALRKCAPRLYDVHMKDSLAVPGTLKDVPAEVGAGRMDIRGIVQALLAMKFGGVVSFEYEKMGGNPIIGLTESVGYVRGLLAAMAG